MPVEHITFPQPLFSSLTQPAPNDPTEELHQSHLSACGQTSPPPLSISPPFSWSPGPLEDQGTPAKAAGLPTGVWDQLSEAPPHGLEAIATPGGLQGLIWRGNCRTNELRREICRGRGGHRAPPSRSFPAPQRQCLLQSAREARLSHWAPGSQTLVVSAPAASLFLGLMKLRLQDSLVPM